jgi:hypothetical protein
MENKVDELQSHTSSNIAYCEMSHKNGWPPLIRGPLFYRIDKANITANCLENQYTVHNLCDSP